MSFETLDPAFQEFASWLRREYERFGVSWLVISPAAIVPRWSTSALEALVDADLLTPDPDPEGQGPAYRRGPAFYTIPASEISQRELIDARHQEYASRLVAEEGPYHVGDRLSWVDDDGLPREGVIWALGKESGTYRVVIEREGEKPEFFILGGLVDRVKWFVDERPFRLPRAR
jgi:hypothetical protein